MAKKNPGKAKKLTLTFDVWKSVGFGRPEALNEKDKEMALTMFNGSATKIDMARHFISGNCLRSAARNNISIILLEQTTASTPTPTHYQHL
jgi:hypothetical protein